MAKTQRKQSAAVQRPNSAAMTINGSPLSAIRQHCLDCRAGSWKEVELCGCDDCALYPFRFGKRPTTARKQGKQVEPKPD